MSVRVAPSRGRRSGSIRFPFADHVQLDLVPSPSSRSISVRASLMRFALNPPARPRFDVSSERPPPACTVVGWRSSGNCSARSALYRLAITSAQRRRVRPRRDDAILRPLHFRSGDHLHRARDLARVLDGLMRPLSSRPFAMSCCDHVVRRATRRRTPSSAARSPA